MALLTCGCLNVKIHVKSTDLTEAPLSEIEGANEKAVFFRQKVAFAQINLEGIEQRHSCLLSTHIEACWTAYRCTNCEMWTHATHQTKPSCLLVNISLHKDSSAVQLLEKHADYSPLFKIVLHDQNANRTGSVGVQSEKYESLQQVLTHIQEQLNTFLVSQEQDMETSIKRFVESQRKTFSELQCKARRDKNVMIHMILSAEQDDANSNCDVVDSAKAIATNGDLLNHNTVGRVAAAGSEKFGLANIEEGKELKSPDNATNLVTKSKVGFHTKSATAAMAKPVATLAPVKTAKPSGFTQSTSALSRKLVPQIQKPKISSDPEAALFDMDPQFADEHDSTEPFYMSDDDLQDTDDSGVDTPPHNLNLFSTSVPISVPAFTTSKKTKFAEDNLDSNSPLDDPGDIAASIKALARSVHGDGKDIFGELPRRPRPRFNPSADFSNM